MVKDNTTPEERLLKIIEDPQVEKRKLASRAKATAGAITNFGFFKRFKIDKDVLKNIDLHAGNKIIAGICGIVTIFLIFDLIRINTNMGNRFQKLSSGAPVSKTDIKALAMPPINLDTVLREARRRNIFTFISQKPQDNSLVAQPADAIANLKLVGILWSSNPQAMIESTQENKTYLVNAGEQVGSFKIKTILREKVIIQKGEEQWELR